MTKPKKQQKNTDPEPTPPRRSFLQKLWIGLGIVALAEFFGVGIAFLRPRKPAARKGDFGSIIEAGPVEKFAPDSVTAFIRGQFYLSRLEDGGFIALSRRCTHLGCTVPWDADKKKFLCPCHSSAFDIRGDIISPPASRALDIYPVTIENAIVKVDTGRKIRRNGFESSQVVYS
jgi:cytochrome b6-f complex iron-sulfur subunit